MTTHELRELFLKEHKRDRRFTFINYLIIAFIVILVVGLIAALVMYSGGSIASVFTSILNGGSDSASTPWWVPFIFGGVFVGAILYPFYHMWRLSKRPAKIEELLKKIEAGSKATTIQDRKEYKVTVPLLKVNLKLCPITYATIYLNDDVKPYDLPINSFVLPDLKIVLSGANLEKLNEIRDMLYSEDEETETITAAPSVPSSPSIETVEDNTPTPIKSVEEFRTFLDENLKETVEVIDKQRSNARKMTMILTPLVILVVFGAAGYFFYNSFTATAAGDYSGQSTIKMVVPFFLFIIVVGFIYSYFMRMKAKKAVASQTVAERNLTAMYASGASFNEIVLSKIVKFINPTVEYVPLGHVGLPEFLESGMFIEKNYGIRGNDQIHGRHNGVPFIMCELWVDHKRNFSDEKDGPDSVFSGQFFVARFNKKFSSPVYIKPKKGFWSTGGPSGYTSFVGDKVKLEDPEFMEMFEVHAEDQVEARYILTPTVMERIKELAKRTKGEFYIAFNNNKITVANNSNSSNFSTGGYFSSLTKDDNKLLVDFYKNICDQFTIIDDLKLNVKIWG